MITWSTTFLQDILHFYGLVCPVRWWRRTQTIVDIINLKWSLSSSHSASFHGPALSQSTAVQALKRGWNRYKWCRYSYLASMCQDQQETAPLDKPSNSLRILPEEQEIHPGGRDLQQGKRLRHEEEARDMSNSQSAGADPIVDPKNSARSGREAASEGAGSKDGTKDMEASVKRTLSMWTVEEKESFMSCFKVFSRSWVPSVDPHIAKEKRRESNILLHYPALAQSSHLNAINTPERDALFL